MLISCEKTPWINYTYYGENGETLFKEGTPLEMIEMYKEFQARMTPRRQCYRKINIMETWKEFNTEAIKSLKDDFETEPYPGQWKILRYLRNGTIKLTATCVGNDVFSGEIIGPLYYMTDGRYCWLSTLEYYVRKYNLRLPTEFEKKILG